VRVAANGQTMAPAQAAALEDLATVGSGHALAKAMHAHAAADLWLIRSFRHVRSSLKVLQLPGGSCGQDKIRIEADRREIIPYGGRFGQFEFRGVFLKIPTGFPSLTFYSGVFSAVRVG